MTAKTPRWQCPKCDGTNVQISMPTWYTETTDYELTFVEPDVEAEVLWWYCMDCDETDSGEPAEFDPDANQLPLFAE